MIDEATFTKLVIAIAQRSLATRKFATHRVALLYGIQLLKDLDDDRLAYIVKGFKGGLPEGPIVIAFQLSRPEQVNVRAIKTRVTKFFLPRITNGMIFMAAIHLAYDDGKFWLQNNFS